MSHDWVVIYGFIVETIEHLFVCWLVLIHTGWIKHPRAKP